MSLAHLLPLQMEQMIAIRVMTQSRLHLQFTMLRLKPILQSKRTVSDTKQHGNCTTVPQHSLAQEEILWFRLVEIKPHHQAIREVLEILQLLKKNYV